MEYDKNNKKKLVLDYHNKEINKYILDKNKFSLKNFKLEIDGKDKNECAEYLLNSNLEGFKYFGNRNKCYLFNTNNFSKPIDKNLMKKYNIINKKKYKYLKDYDSYHQQKNVNNYFKEINNYDFMFEGNIDKKNVENLEECLDYCHNEDNCKNILYMKEKDRCEFYGSKDILDNEVGKDYDTYTKNKQIKNNNKIDIINKNDKKVPIYNDNDIYTDCVETKDYNNYKEMVKDYNKICKRELGNEYTFNNIDDNRNIINCDLNNKKIRCNLDLMNKNIIENFNNNFGKLHWSSNNFLKYSRIIIFTIFIIYCIYILFNKN